MNDPVTNRDRHNAKFFAQPIPRYPQGSGNVLHILDRISPVRQLLAFGAAGTQSRAIANPVDLSLDLAGEAAIAVDGKALKLHT